MHGHRHQQAAGLEASVRQHQRKDPVSEYLDRMDRIFYREVEKPLSGDFLPE